MRRAILVGVRGDLRESTSADFEIVQSSVHIDALRRFYVPHWPQPGLLPRDPQRGHRIERLEYKGFLGNLHASFREPLWASFLAERGLEWVVDAVAFRQVAEHTTLLRWNDFRTTDLVVAMRPDAPGGHTNKPATKLYNAWLAGVPALLGREPAFRELRRDPLDYLEVSSAEEIRGAVDLLLAEPRRYEAMVAHGRLRAAEYTAGLVLRRWVELLWERLPELAPRQRVRHLPVLLRSLIRRVQRFVSGRPAR